MAKKKNAISGITVMGGVGISSFNVENVDTVLYTKDEGFAVTTNDGVTLSVEPGAAFNFNVDAQEA